MFAQQTKTKIILFIVVFLTLIVFILGVIASKKNNIANNNTTPDTQATPDTSLLTKTTSAQETDTSFTTIVQTSTFQASQPSELTEMLSSNNISYEDLEKKGCRQLVTVIADGGSADIRYFTCSNNQWIELPQLISKGYVGRNGVSNCKKESDGSTPMGLYRIGSAFYIDNAPRTGLDTFKITSNTYWIDDPDSKFYNQRVEGTNNKDWSSAEHMIQYDEYQYGFVINYNMPAIPNAGSAIFFHINDNTTSGCIATDEEAVLSYLENLDKAKNPYILITTD